jgi:hypothetical protein
MDRESTIELIGGLVSDAKDLAAAHVEGLRLEVKQELADLKTATAYAAAAAAVFAVAALLAAFSLVQALWLYTSLPSWAAYLIIAALFAVGGVILVQIRARKPRDIDLVPESELSNLKRDASWLASRARDAVT